MTQPNQRNLTSASPPLLTIPELCYSHLGTEATVLARVIDVGLQRGLAKLITGTIESIRMNTEAVVLVIKPKTSLYRLIVEMAE